MKLTGPCLWFASQALEATGYYVSLFDDSRIVEVLRYQGSGPMPADTVLTVRFIVNGQPMMALNGGPAFSFNPAISMVVECDNQAEVDHLWARLCEGGAPSQCGWLTDRYGLSWQVVPSAMLDMLRSPDSAAAGRAMTAMMQMSKLDIATLQAAFNAAP